jgi:hypothetical protein
LLTPIIATLEAHDHFRAMMVGGGTVLAAALVYFIIPMKLYVIGFLRALGLLIVAFIVSVVAVAVTLVIGLKVLGGEKDAVALQRQFARPGHSALRFVQRLDGQEAPDEIDRLLDDALDPIGSTPLPAREVQVQVLQQKLQARKRTFPPGTLPPAEYQDQLSRYMMLLNEVNAERAAGAPAR